MSFDSISIYWVGGQVRFLFCSETGRLRANLKMFKHVWKYFCTLKLINKPQKLEMTSIFLAKTHGLVP